MDKILSKDEVDSLLDGISEGKIATGAARVRGEEKEVTNYDFGAKIGPIHLNLPTLMAINEKLAGLLTTSLSNVTRSNVDVTVSDTESVRLGDYLQSIAVPTSLNIFKILPLKGYCILSMESALVFAFVETLFGGKEGKNVNIEKRTFTNIETKVIEKIVKLVFGDVEKAWSDFYKINVVYSRSEIDPQLARIGTPSDVIIIARLKLNGQSTSGEMTLCIPYATVDPIRDKLRFKIQNEDAERDQTWRKYIEDKLKNVSVKVSCTLGRVRMSGKRLIELKGQDIIKLNQKVGEPVIICIEGIPKFKGHPGTYNKKQAVRIEGPIIRRQ